jgi:hypothetical protein
MPSCMGGGCAWLWGPGTLAGGGVALVATGDPVVAMLYGMAGFSVSAIGLRLRVPRRERRLLGS